ncbi:MAG: diaminopimelate epimerase [Bacilli bacterium]|nr:diaminopimelate epimerase [Bacilli bacterium]
MPFVKMHGCANDYIYIDCLKTTIDNPNELAKIMSPRHFSVGSDGLVLICPSDVADFKMRMFNLDGSEGKMCGNAIRCVGKYVYDSGYTTSTELSIETLSGIKYLSLHVVNGKVQTVSVKMGQAKLNKEDIPVVSNTDTVISQTVSIAEGIYTITCVSMGNPHCITYVEDVKRLDLEKLGPKFEFDPMFPERVNTEFIHVIDRTTLDMRVWERGSGETWACGTGACAATVSSVLNGYCDYDAPITIHLLGGDLKITVDHDLNVLMEGPATKVYEGVYEYEC